MSITAANNNPYSFQYVSSAADGSGVRKLNESKFQNEEKTYLKYSTQDQRNAKVTEKLDESKNLQDYNTLLQQNTPAAKLLGILKAFNETKKVSEATDEKDYTEFEEIDESAEAKAKSQPDEEIGFYVVIDDDKPKKDFKRIKKPIDLWRGRINNIYHLGFMKEPGTLVNVVV